jgi:hypothetical protein
MKKKEERIMSVVKEEAQASTRRNKIYKLDYKSPKGNWESVFFRIQNSFM